MKRLGLVFGVLWVVGVAVWFFFLRGPGEFTFADRDCDRDDPVMATTLYGDLRQDDIAVIDRDGGVKRLTKDHASIEPSFSPDGDQIVYTSGSEGLHEECCGYSDQEIYVMNSDGSDQRRLMPDDPPGEDLWENNPAWSPDGELIAFHRYRTGLMTVPAQGGEPTLIYPQEKLEIDSIEWSPDGDQLIFVLGNDDVMLVNRDGSDARELIDKLGYGMKFTWSPDGTIAFSRTYDVFTFTLEEPNPRHLMKDAFSPEYSPDGRWIAYYETESGDSPRLVVAPAGGGEAAPIEIDRKNMYSFATDLEWLDCR